MGFAAVVSRYGEKWAVRHAQAWRRLHPSTLEQAIMLTLDDLGVPYEREFWLATKTSGRRQRVYLVDFMVSVGGIDYAIEVDGAWAHSFHARRDQLKRRLLKRRGYPTLTIREIDIRAGCAEAMLVEFLGLKPKSALVPKRGMHLRKGDIVSPNRGDAYRILHIEADAGVTCSGVWLDLNADASVPEWKRRQRFTIYQPRFYTTLPDFETKGLCHA